MNLKNTTILLILLLAIMGLLIGIYYTEADNIEKTSENSEDTLFEDSNDIITINVQPKGKNESVLDNFT